MELARISASRYGLGVLLFLLVLSAPVRPCRCDPLAPEMLPASDRVWEDLFLLELAGLLPAGTTAMRPASRGEVAAWVAALSDNGTVGSPSLARLHRAFARELRRLAEPRGSRETPALLRRAGGADPRDSLAVDGALSELRIGPTLEFGARGNDKAAVLGDSTRVGIYGVFLSGRSASIQGEIQIGKIRDGRRFGDPLIAGTDILYYLEEVSAAVSTGGLRLRMGRWRDHWGSGRSPALLLDGSAQPIDKVEWQVLLPAGLRFRSWAGSLNIYEGRGIAAHRLEIPFGDNLMVALSEGVRYQGGPGHPLYLLGILPYTLVQRLDWQDTRADSLRGSQRNNVLADAELVWRPRRGSLITMELLVDDVPATTGKSPARLGAKLGVHLMPRFAGRQFDLSLEGTKVSRYAYSVYYRDECECDWIHQDRAIGEPGGPDHEAMRLRAGRSITRDHRVEMMLMWANHGAGELGEAWLPDQTGLSHPTRRALTVSGPVLRDRRAGLRWRWEPRDNATIDLEAGLRRGRRGGEGGATGYRNRFTFGLRGGWRL